MFLPEGDRLVKEGNPINQGRLEGTPGNAPLMNQEWPMIGC